jgi:hypothetical protein
MFVRAYVELPLPVERLAGALTDQPQRWLPGIAASSEEMGDKLLLQVGFPIDHHRLDRKVMLDLGAPVQTPGRTWLPITWRAAAQPSLFPDLEGELEVAPLGKELTQVGLSARYKPPFGMLGESLDRALLHRVAEATVRDFVERVAAGLVELSRARNGRF